MSLKAKVSTTITGKQEQEHGVVLECSVNENIVGLSNIV